MNRVFITTGGALALVLLLNACGADGNDTNGGSNTAARSTSAATSNDIMGSVKEWEVNADATTAEAGTVNFTITNEGTIGHEFLIVKTDIAPGDIPVDGDHFPEDASGIEVIDEIGEFTKGTTESLTVTLEPGSYQLVCNLPDHYGNGMFVGFEVLG
jgi:uncharacterized cupredoxin-like copper-binding protein